MTPDERQQLSLLAERVRRLAAYCPKRPHIFLEDKSEIARDIERLATPDAEPERRPAPDLKVSFGTALRRSVTAGRGVQVAVERRQRTALNAPRT